MPVRIREPRSHRLVLVSRGSYICKALSEHENRQNALWNSPSDLGGWRLNEADISHETSTTLVDTFADDRALPIVPLPKLLPITSFNEDEKQQAMIWADCYRAQFRVWCAGCKFTGIGVHNLMANPTTNCGTLIDLDLPVRGYTAFMSLDLLTDRYFDGKVAQLYRHEAESFIWAIAWLFLDGKCPALIKTWSTADYNTCYQEKLIFLDEQPLGDFVKNVSGHPTRFGRGVPNNLLWILANDLLEQLWDERCERHREKRLRAKRNTNPQTAHSSIDADPAPILTEQSDTWAYFHTFDESVRKVLVDLPPMDTEFQNAPFTA